jgi:predicted dehydrogenase
MSSHVSRRQFLGTSAGTAAALASGPLLAQQGDLPSQRVTVGVMGLSRGRSLAINFARTPGVRVKYVCDVDIERAGVGADQVEKDAEQRPRPITDFQEILDDEEVDALVCAAPNHWHAPATIMACKAGKHTYVEKPCSHNPWEGELMVQAARKYDRAVQMGTQRRSSAAFQEAIGKLHEGIIGRVYCSRSWYNNIRGSIGTGKPAEVPERLNYELWQGPAPRVPYYDNRLHYNWHWFWHWGNGELGNNGVHSLDISRWGMQVDYPVHVVSSGGRYAYEDDQQTPDTHVATFEFAERKQITWLGKSCNRRRDGNAFVTFYGEEGAMELGSTGEYKVVDKNDKLIDEGERQPMADAEHILNFVTAIRTGKHRELNAEILEGHKSTLLCHLGNIAYRVGQTLTCNKENGHIIGNEQAMNLWQREYEPGWEPTI